VGPKGQNEREGEAGKAQKKEREIPLSLSDDKVDYGNDGKDERERRGQKRGPGKNHQDKKLRRILKVLGVSKEIKDSKTTRIRG
jgi:hypothetical protein